MYPGKVPSKELPVLPTTITPHKCRKPPKPCPSLVVERETDSLSAEDTTCRNIGVNGGKPSESTSEKMFRPHALPPLEEFVLVLDRLRLGLMEQDLAYRLWVTKHCLLSNNFKQVNSVVTYDMYPSTRVITEIYVEQPHLPELQQMTFKNDNTYKALLGVSPSGSITFGSISDKQLTCKSGILDLQ